jgi:hypothetical protein
MPFICTDCQFQLHNICRLERCTCCGGTVEKQPLPDAPKLTFEEYLKLNVAHLKCQCSEGGCDECHPDCKLKEVPCGCEDETCVMELKGQCGCE